MKLVANGKDISQLYTSCTWSGSKDQAARELKFNVVVSGTDKNLPQPHIAPESEVNLFTDDEELLFKGYVVTREKSIEGNTMSVTCMDELFYFNQSKGTFNFEKKPPNAIAKEVFSKFGLPVGHLEGGSPITRKFDVESLYTIVFTAYKLENEKTKKPYKIRMKDGKAEVVEQGKIVAKYVLDTESTLIDAKYSDSAENLLTHVKMYDTDGKEIGEVELNKKIGAKDLYRQEKDEDPKSRAEGKLRELEKSASVRVFGNTDLMTGNAVMVKEPFTGLNGKFFIDSDTHTWENNKYIVELELNFKNIMADLDTGDKKSSNTSANIGGVAGKAISAGESIKGTRYKWGGTNPKTGVDCSGFITWAYKQAGANIPGRITSDGIRSNPKALGFEEIPFSQRQAGDVVWQKGHVAMVYPGGKILESGGTTKRTMGYSGVGITNAKGRPFSKAYRYVGG